MTTNLTDTTDMVWKASKTLVITFSTPSNPVETRTVRLRENCAQAALNTLVYQIQSQTIYLSNLGRLVKGVTLTDARLTASDLRAQCRAINCLTDFSASNIVGRLMEDIDIAMAKATQQLKRTK
jgi:hypothetical protein